jgi:hypothetical protein
MKRIVAVLIAAALLPSVAHAEEAFCLRGDGIGHVSMTGPNTATASDRHGKKFDITFVSACGARHQNVFFVLRPESLPACVVPGTGLQTNSEGVCVIKTIVAKQ